MTKINAEINVKINSNISEHEQLQQVHLPFVPFIEFDDLKTENKIFLFGRSGSGKSRALVELVKMRLDIINNIQNVYVINPLGYRKNISRLSVSNIASKVTEHDLVVWDNFPDDMSLAVDVRSGLSALATISSARVKNLIVTLNPRLLEKYRNNIGRVDDYLATKEVAYDQNNIKSIIEEYGNNSSQLKPLFNEYIENYIDEVSVTLYRKEPTPFAILTFLEALKRYYDTSQQKKIDIIKYARQFPLASDYYKRQFEKLANSRPNEADFLYALKLCYELDLGRTTETVSNIQKILLQSEPPSEPSKKLSIWLFLSWEGFHRYYSLHDLPKSAIDYAADRKFLLMRNFCNRISEIMEKNSDSRSLSWWRAAGRFVGLNIQFLPRGREKEFVPNSILSFVESNSDFRDGLGEGCSNNFSLLNKNFQIAILELVNKYANSPDDRFPFSVAVGIGSQFHDLDASIQQKILELAKRSIMVVSGLDHTIGYNFPNLDASIQQKILELAKRNRHYASFLSKVIGNNFPNLDASIQQKILELAKRNRHCAVFFSFDIGYNFPNLDASIQQKILELAKRNRHFAFGLGYGIGSQFHDLDASIQQKILELAKRNKEFANTFLSKKA